MNDPETSMRVSILPEETSWRARKVRYHSGSWDAVLSLLPEFDLRPFAMGPNEPSNPFLQTVVRQPLSAAERPTPVATVSHTYSLVQHRAVAELCRNVLLKTGVASGELRYEVGLSELGEWMNFRIYLPENHGFVDDHGKLDLRLEGFNSVDGSTRLVIQFGWFRLVCLNGMIIGETKIDIRERHGQGLDLKKLPERIGNALDAIMTDRSRMERWQKEKVMIADVQTWCDKTIATEWGKKAAARVFHICDTGRDIKIANPFAKGKATEKPVHYLDRVGGSPDQATTKYDVAQALSFVATHLNNAEERISRQGQIPLLLEDLYAWLDS